MHAKASIKNHVIAEAEHFQFVEGNIYFPLDSVKNGAEVLTPSATTTHCPWKGESTYYDLHVDGHTYRDAAWGYLEPKDKAKHIKDHVAFDKHVVSTKKN